MSEDSKKREIGNDIYMNEFQFFKWKIPNVSSVPQRVDYVLQSPPFSFKDSSWILKMYPYGQTKYGTAGYMDVIIEWLPSHSRNKSGACLSDCIMDCENAFKKEIVPIIRGKYSFNSEWPQAKIMRFMRNLKECPEKCVIAPNDTLTLVFGFDFHSGHQPGHQIELDKTAVGKTYTASGRNDSQDIGELIKLHSVLVHFVWKVCFDKQSGENGCRTFQFPEDYQVQSKPFNLDRASWILKLYPYFRMERSGKPSYDVVLERLHSEIPEHHIILKMSENQNVIERSFSFNSSKTHGDVISVQLTEENFRERSCLPFFVEIFIKKDLGVELNPMEVVQSTVVTGCNTTSNDPMTLSGTKALTDLKELFLKQEDCDVVIKVQGQEFQAHRAILRARSPVFASTFRNNMKEMATGVVEIEDCDPSSFSDFLCFIYCGHVDNLTTENVFSLFTTADKYDVQDLRSQCLEFIKNNLSIRSFCNAVTLVLQYSEDELLQLSLDFFAENLQEVIMTVEWQRLLIENPIQCNELLIKALKSNKVGLNSNG